MAFEIDTSEVGRLSVDLDKATSKMLPEVEKVVSKGALNVKNEARRMASGIGHAPAYPASIGYDVAYGFGHVEGVIGPDKDRRQGALGNILEYGTVNNAPRPHLAPALDAEEPRFVKALEDLAVKALEL